MKAVSRFSLKFIFTFVFFSSLSVFFVSEEDVSKKRTAGFRNTIYICKIKQNISAKNGKELNIF